MADMFEALGVQKEVVDEIKEQTVSEGFLVDSGVYKAEVKELYVRKTDSGANMLEMVFELEGGKKLAYSTCVKSGDSNADSSKHFKTTYTKNGKEFPLPGITESKHLMQAMKMTALDTVVGKVKHRDEEIEALTIPTAVGKKLMLGVKQEESLYEGNISIKNFIYGYYNTEGENSKGEQLADKAAELIAKNPLKKIKGSAGSKTSGNKETVADAPTGWN